MWVVRVRDRGRDLATHVVETVDEARELGRVYEQLGYPADKVALEATRKPEQKVAA